MRLRARYNIRLSSLVLLGGLSLMLAGCATSGPKWARETPEGFRYDYVVGTGEAATLSEALVAAEANARAQVALVNSRVSVDQDVQVSTREDSRGIEMSSSEEIKVELQGLPVTILGWERVETREEMDLRTGDMRVRGLYRREKASGVRNPPSSAGFVARSVILPGWGQRTMERDAQATLYTTSYLASWATFAAAFYIRDQEVTKLNNAQDAIEQARALSAVNQWGNVRNVALGAAAVVWTASLLDALSSDPRFLPILSTSPVGGGVDFSWGIARSRQ
ncbi:hypothetical protein OAJ07_03135 [Gemmatimonadales bacterium]|nr:hypothetical protein [Gemmatimonadales bacterium]